MSKPEWACAPIAKPERRKPARKQPLPWKSPKRRLEADEREHVRLAVAKRQGYQCIARGLGLGECASPHGHRPDLEVHEIKTRGRGGSHLNVNNCVGLCQRHHDWVTDHPVEAREMRLVLIPRGTRMNDTTSALVEAGGQSHG